MTKEEPKRPVSFRLIPAIHDKLKAYCEYYNLNQTSVIEELISTLETDTAPPDLQPLTLPILAKKIHDLETKVEELTNQRPAPMPTAKPKTTNRSDTTQPQTASPDAEYYTSREAGNVMGYSENSDVSRNLKRAGLEPVQIGAQAYGWNKEAVHALAKERGINPNQ